MGYTLKQIKEMNETELAEANRIMTRKLVWKLAAFAAVKYILIRQLSKPWRHKK